MDDWGAFDLDMLKQTGKEFPKFDLLACVKPKKKKKEFPKFDFAGIDPDKYVAKVQEELKVAIDSTLTDYFTQTQEMTEWTTSPPLTWAETASLMKKAKTMAKYNKSDKWWIEEYQQKVKPCPCDLCTPVATPARQPNELLADRLPGLRAVTRCPAEATGTSCETKRLLWGVVIHLNDVHEWSRDTIADWLETLDIDLTFPTTEEES